MKIVNGEVIREAPSGSSSGASSSGASFNEDAVIFGKPFPRWQLGLMVGVALILFGLKGAFLTGIVLGGGFLYSNGGAASGATSGGAGAGGGMQRMSTKPGANIRGMSDLPPAPKSS